MKINLSFVAVALLISTISQSASAELEEIIVTARKVEESLQTTPLSVTALDSEALELKGISTPIDLSGYVPSLIVGANATGSNDITVTLRGLSTADAVATRDSTVAFYIDGSLIPRISGGLLNILDLERVEVLRGPQGSLYGRNSTAGAINYITRDPAEEFGGHFKQTFGSYNALNSLLSIDTGLLGDSGFKATISYMIGKRDGWINNLNQSDDKDGGAKDDRSLRIAMQWQINEKFLLDYSYTKLNSDNTYATAHLSAIGYLPGEVFKAGGSPPDLQTQRTKTLSLNASGSGISKTDFHTLALSWDISDNLTLKSISGYRDWNGREINNDLDGNDILQALAIDFTLGAAGFTPEIRDLPGLFHSPLNRRNQSHFSQELQLLGTSDANINYVLGLYYFDENYSEFNPTEFYLPASIVAFIPMIGGGPGAGGFLPNPFTPGNPTIGAISSNTLDYNGTSQSLAAYGQASWNITDQLRLTGGLRYTSDEKKLNQTVGLSTAPFSMSGSSAVDFSNITWNLTTDYQFNDDFFGYLRIATGYKAGGISARSSGQDNLFFDDFNEEKLIGYEGGIKVDLLKKRLRINASVFYNEFDDFQINSFLAGSGGATSIIEGADVTQTGLEIDFVALLNDKLRIDGNFSYINSKFDKYLLPNRRTDQVVDVAGLADFPYVPDATAALGLQYDQPLGFGNLTVRVDYRYVDDRLFHQINEVPGIPDMPATIDPQSPFGVATAADSYSLFDIYISLNQIKLGMTELQVSLWGRNLADKEYRVQGIDFGALGFGNNVYGDPRTYGVDIKLLF